MGDLLKRVSLISRIITALDVILAALIIFFSFSIIKSELGAYSLAFGFGMLTITVIFKLLKKW